MDRCRLLGFPKLFITIAPAEWKYPVQQALLSAYKAAKRITDIQGLLTIHLHHTMCSIVDDILRKSDFFDLIDYSLRVEFQKRGTLHVHLCAWVTFYSKAIDPVSGKCILNGRSRSHPGSPLLHLFESVFHSDSVDIQAGGDLAGALLTYVTGYAAKAEDSLQWKTREYGSRLLDHKWLTTYRLLCKRAPLQPEMFVDFFNYPCMIHSFQFSTVYASVPWFLVKVGDDYLIDGLKPKPRSGSFIGGCICAISYFLHLCFGF